MLHVVTADEATVFILSLFQALDHSGHGQIQDEHRDEDDEAEEVDEGYWATASVDSFSLLLLIGLHAAFNAIIAFCIRKLIHA